MSPRRRRATVLAAATVLCAAAAPGASATPFVASTAPYGTPAATGAVPAAATVARKPGKLPGGLYGTADPKYDGVWRQSMALLALDGAGAVPAKKAVDWLAEQQCADGSFTAYRADSGEKCDPDATPSDTNATALAAQALAAVGGRSDGVREALEWLTSVQNKDGGWGSAPRSASDANSTSLVIGALHTVGKNPAKETAEGGASPYDALLSLQLTCDSKNIEDASGQQGAFAYQPDKKGKLAPNDDATAAASLAALGEGALPEPLAKGSQGAEDKPVKPLKCASGGDESGQGASGREASGGNKEIGRGMPGGRKGAADAGAAYLAATLEKNGGHFSSVLPGAEEKQPDYANTADAVVALAAGGHRKPAKSSLSWLAKNLDKWDKSRNDPAAISTLMLATRAAGGDPTELGGTNLLSRLNHTGPKPAKMPADDAGSSSSDKKDDGGTIPIWAFILVGLAVGAGVGILLSGRRKKQQL